MTTELFLWSFLYNLLIVIFSIPFPLLNERFFVNNFENLLIPKITSVDNIVDNENSVFLYSLSLDVLIIRRGDYYYNKSCNKRANVK